MSKDIYILHTFTCLSFVLAGVLLMALTTVADLRAELTGQGSNVLVQQQASGAPRLEPAPFHGAAFEEEERGAGFQIILGMLLILLGFGLHAILTARRERPVAVHGAKPKLAERGIGIATVERIWIRRIS